jgi:hypothetical protein
MFLALFLVPWVLVYAISTIVMNHRAERGRAEFTVVEERPYSVEYSPDEERNEVASRIMADLDLEGKHGVWGTLEDGSIGIHRHRALKDLLVKIDLKESELVIEESDFSIVRFLNNMHRRRGYNLDYFQDDAWSFSVDLFIIGMIFWALSGLWMWWELKVTRRWGSIVMGSGVALFALFLLTI